MEIKNEKHFNLNSIVMESKVLKVKLLPDLGFKMASLIYKPKNMEILFQPTNKKYSIPQYGDYFEKYDTSGLDEMIPTIDKCVYPEGTYKGNILPDHGDVWSIPWHTDIKKDTIVGKVKLKSLPLEFHKSLTFETDNVVRVEYKVKNLGNENISYLWALHGLMIFDDETKIIFPKEAKNILNVHENSVLGSCGERYSFPLVKDIDDNLVDLSYLKHYRDGESYKYYFLDDLKVGEVGLHYLDKKVKYILRYDTKKIPYLGVWVTQGGFKGEYNCAIEPSNGFYDSVEIAYEKRKLPELKSKEEDFWTIYMEIKED